MEIWRLATCGHVLQRSSFRLNARLNNLRPRKTFRLNDFKIKRFAHPLPLVPAEFLCSSLQNIFVLQETRPPKSCWYFETRATASEDSLQCKWSSLVSVSGHSVLSADRTGYKRNAGCLPPGLYTSIRLCTDVSAFFFVSRWLR